MKIQAGKLKSKKCMAINFQIQLKRSSFSAQPEEMALCFTWVTQNMIKELITIMGPGKLIIIS